jgi:hypothetical protein
LEELLSIGKTVCQVLHNANNRFLFVAKGDTEPLRGYRSHVWLPILKPEGQVGGLFHSMVDTTEKVLSERRMAAIRDMGERTCECGDN